MDGKTLAYLHGLFNAAATGTAKKIDELERLSFVRSFDDASFVVDKQHKIGYVSLHKCSTISNQCVRRTHVPTIAIVLHYILTKSVGYFFIDTTSL